MRLIDVLTRSMMGFAFAFGAAAAWAADYPTPKEEDWVVRDFRFHTGDVLPELRQPAETGVLDREIRRVKNGRCC